jgi:hypothetical protein
MLAHLLRLRASGGKLTKEKVGKNEKVAQRRKDKLQVQEDEGSFEALNNIKFEKWADQWLARSNVR